MVWVKHETTGRMAQVSPAALPALNARGWQQVQPPGKKASKADWQQYALLVQPWNRRQIEDATKAELIDRYGTEEPTN